PALEVAARASAQGAERIFGGETIDELAILALHAACPSPERHCLRLKRPRRIQLLTLPSGLTTRRAISSCERPSTKASVRHLRVLSGNWPMQKSKLLGLSNSPGAVPDASATSASESSPTRVN